MRGEPGPKKGLLKLATETGMLYIDEVNLLDDHIVNLILDVVQPACLSLSVTESTTFSSTCPSCS